jgi:ATPase subunit of ABC transporter with duplicated ATPase domains
MIARNHIFGFPGPITATSHDRIFIAHVVADVWEPSDGTLLR